MKESDTFGVGLMPDRVVCDERLARCDEGRVPVAVEQECDCAEGVGVQVGLMSDERLLGLGYWQLPHACGAVSGACPEWASCDAVRDGDIVRVERDRQLSVGQCAYAEKRRGGKVREGVRK